ncbi:MAG: extracellular solute-binding protein [Peptococcaceae bacterium]|jgi:molybdate/tungstate transport system substrate-binding protein|nr:extracellular solute-binding protein [Peptococcaceae bacterium]
MAGSKLFPILIAAVAVGAVVTGCGPAPAARQTADVAYAGSLQLVNSKYIHPAFTKATGSNYRGRGGGSLGLANQIKAGEIHPNVFESVGNAPIEGLEPRYTTWSVGFAATPLVLAYSPQSPYASRLKAIADGQKPLVDLFALMEQPGFHLGRTNPETDPQGQAFIIMLKLAAEKYRLPAGTVDKIIGTVNNPKQIFAETALESRLEAGQLDACSAFLSQAVQRKLAYIKLPDDINQGNPELAASYASQSVTLKNGKVVKGSPLVLYVTTIGGTPDQRAGVSFVKYLLSPAGLKTYQDQGYTLLPKKEVKGDVNAIPADIKSELP